MLVSFAACGGNSDKSGDAGDSDAVSIVGEWKLVSAESGGQTVDESQLAGLDYSWTFEEGEKANITILGQSTDATYTFEDPTVTFAAPADAYVLKLEGSKLVYDDEATATKLFFEKQ
jgi:hypothetical protein